MSEPELPSENKKRRAARNIGIYSAGSLTRQLVGFFMLPVYTRFLTPADYGVVALLSMMISIFELVFGARFAQAVPRFFYETDDPKKRASTVCTALVLTSSISAVGIGILASGSGLVSNVLFGVSDYAPFVLAYSFLLLTIAVEHYGLTYIRLLERPILFVLVSLSKVVLQLGLNIYLIVFQGLGVTGVVISAVASSAVVGFLMAGFILRRTGLNVDFMLARRLIAFSWPLWFAGGAALYIGSSTRYFLRLFTDLSDVGLFELASKFAALVTIVAWVPFAQWWQTERFTLLKREDKGRPVFRSVFTLVSAAVLFVSVGISVFGGVVVVIMADDSFHAAAQAIPPIAMASSFAVAGIFHNFNFMATDKTKEIAIIGYFEAVLLTVVLLVLIPRFGFIGAAYSILVSKVAVFLITFTRAKKALDTGTRLDLFVVMAFFGGVVVITDQSLLSGLSLVQALATKSVLMFSFLMLLIIVALRESHTNLFARQLMLEIQRRFRRHF